MTPKSNVCVIKINDTEYTLRFAMPAIRWFMEKIAQGHVLSMGGGLLNETGISYLIYAGHYNECIANDKPPTLQLPELMDWVEENSDKPEAQQQFHAIAEAWKDNVSLKRYIDKANELIQAAEEIKKKMPKNKSTGMKSKRRATAR